MFECTWVSAYNHLTSPFCKTRQNLFEMSGFVRVNYTFKWYSVCVHVDYVQNVVKLVRSGRHANCARISISTKVRSAVCYNVFLKATSQKIRIRSLGRENKIQKSLRTMTVLTIRFECAPQRKGGGCHRRRRRNWNRRYLVRSYDAA